MPRSINPRYASEAVSDSSRPQQDFKRRRCLVPLASFYEWKKLGPKLKQPYAIVLGHRLIKPHPNSD
jgi:putative SOS response-associated peptidase YedK